jgi:hypothetical protein
VSLALTLKSPPDDDDAQFFLISHHYKHNRLSVFSMGFPFEIKKHSIRVYINLENSQLGDKFLLFCFFFFYVSLLYSCILTIITTSKVFMFAHKRRID